MRHCTATCVAYVPTMRIERCRFEHIGDWARLRAALWPDRPAEDHRQGLAEALKVGGSELAGFVARADSGEVMGFAEASIRHDYVNGCETSPVVFLEGVYVDPAHRRQGMAKALAEAVAAWGRLHGCGEFASDALIENDESHRFHRAIGFAETERVVFFRKAL